MKLSLRGLSSLLLLSYQSLFNKKRAVTARNNNDRMKIEEK